MKSLEELNYEVHLFSKKELNKEELDWDEDLKDCLEDKIKQSRTYEILMCGWDVTGDTFVVVIKVKH